MRIIYSLVFTLFCTVLSAQFGVSAKYNSNNFSDWNDFISQSPNTTADEIHENGYEFGLNYWMRLKDKRIEFLPELSYSINSMITSNTLSPIAIPPVEVGMRSFNINIPAHFYFLDLNSDCNCPTFSKQNDFLSKGLYVFINPGISYNMHSATGGETVNFTNSGISYRLGVGLGYDVGLSDLLTITPFFSYNYGYGYSSDHLIELTSIVCGECSVLPNQRSTLTQLQFGLRFSFRPDYKSNNF